MNLKNKDGKVLFRSKSTDVGKVLKNANDKDWSILENVVLDGVRVSSDYLKGVSLHGITLTNSQLYCENFEDVSFFKANLTGTTFESSSFEDCDFTDANLDGVNFRGADFDLLTLKTFTAEQIEKDENLRLALSKKQFIPEKGAFLGYKKLRDGLVATLQIPARALRSHGAGKERKCRASEAKVLSIVDVSTGKKVTEGFSSHSYNFKYVVGKTVKPRSKFNTDRWNVCSSGIHFFPTFEEAKAYRV